MTDQQKHFRALEKMYEALPVNAYYDPVMKVSNGAAELRLPVKTKYFHAANSVHGSIYFKALDDACFFAANSLMPEHFALTANFNIYLTGLISEGEMIARGRVVKQTGSTFICEATLTDSHNEEIARGSGTFVRSKLRLAPDMGYHI